MTSTACADCLAEQDEEHRPDCLVDVEQPAEPGQVIATLFASATGYVPPAGHVECWRCLSRVYVDLAGEWRAAGETPGVACSAPAAAGGPHVPTTAPEPAGALFPSAGRAAARS